MKVRNLLLASLLLLPFSAQAQLACVGTWFLPGDASTFDVTCSGYGTPVGAVFMGNYSTSYETNATDALIGIGFTDFTNEANRVGNGEDGLLTSVTDHCHIHDSVDSYSWDSPGACIGRRDINTSTTTDGTTHTPNNNTNLYGGVTVNLHTDGCIAFSAGSGTATDATFQVTHGLAGTPNFGIFSYAEAEDAISNHNHFSIGFFNDNGGSHVQKSYARTSQAGLADGENHARLFSDRVGGVTEAASGAEQESIELTGNDGTNTTFTARNSTLDSDLIGILCYEPDKSVWVGNINSPDTAGSDWNETTANFQPELVFIALTNATAEDTSMTDTEAAGNIGLFVTDFTTEVTTIMSSENAADPTNEQSRIDRNLYLLDHDATADYNITNVTASSTGITATAANITTADATTHLWPALFIGSTASTGLLTLRRHN
jgi:hypothetical protein